MEHSVRNIVSDINTALEGIFKGAKFYGVATSVEREGKAQPVVDERPVSFDDSYALQAYHKIISMAVTYQQGFGDTMNTTNTYTMQMVVFNNEKITKLKPDEVAMIIQSILAVNDSATLNGVILNSQQVFAQEYRGTVYSLNEYQSLMQLNYTVEINFKGNCFNLCPEDFSNCKN